MSSNRNIRRISQGNFETLLCEVEALDEKIVSEVEESGNLLGDSSTNARTDNEYENSPQGDTRQVRNLSHNSKRVAKSELYHKAVLLPLPDSSDEYLCLPFCCLKRI